MRFVIVARFRQFIFWLLATIVLTDSPTSHAQPMAKRVPRLGVLLPGVPATYSPRTAALQQALRNEGVTEFVLPVGQLVVYLVLAGLAGVLAAIWPARRAAKLDVLQAISYE